MCMYIYFLALFRSSDTPAGKMSTPSTQVLVSKCHIPLKEPGLFRGSVHSKAGSGKVQDEPNTLYQKVKKYVKNKKG